MVMNKTSHYSWSRQRLWGCAAWRVSLRLASHSHTLALQWCIAFLWFSTSPLRSVTITHCRWRYCSVERRNQPMFNSSVRGREGRTDFVVGGKLSWEKAREGNISHTGEECGRERRKVGRKVKDKQGRLRLRLECVCVYQ